MYRFDGNLAKPVRSRSWLTEGSEHAYNISAILESCDNYFVHVRSTLGVLSHPCIDNATRDDTLRSDVDYMTGKRHE